MPFRVVAFEPTPNPDAVKCVVSPSPTDTPRSYRAPDDAAGDELAARLFEIGAVRGVLIHASFITITRSPGAPWGPIHEGVRRVLGQAP